MLTLMLMIMLYAYPSHHNVLGALMPCARWLTYALCQMAYLCLVPDGLLMPCARWLTYALCQMAYLCFCTSQTYPSKIPPHPPASLYVITKLANFINRMVARIRVYFSVAEEPLHMQVAGMPAWLCYLNQCPGM